MPGKAIVIGAGVVGASVGLELARRGWSVRILEKEEEEGKGSTALSASIVRCHYTKPEAIRLALEGRAIWKNWHEHVGLPVSRARFQEVGVLFLFREGASSPGTALGLKAEMNPGEVSKRYEMLRQLDPSAMLLRKASLEREFPYFAFPEPDVVGLWEPKSGYMAYPYYVMMDLREAGEEAEAVYWTSTKVVGAETEWIDGRRRIRKIVAETPKETIALDVDVVINCAGPDSAGLNVDFKCPMALTTAPLQQYIIEGKWKPVSDEPVPAMADLVEGFYIRPDRDVFKVGAVLPPDHVEFVHKTDGMVDPEDVQLFQTEFLDRLHRRAPQIELEDVQTYVGYYDWTVADSYPVFDATDIEGYYVAIGTSGAWFKAGPAIGQLMAELIERRETGDTNTLYTLPRTGEDIDLAAFSARRSLK